MQIELLELLCCPETSERLQLKDALYVGNLIKSGILVTANGQKSYPIRDFIPRFVPESNYADNFGMQWNMFSKTQLDSYSGQSISGDRFWAATRLTPADIKGKWVLDIGCGAGRFAEIALAAGANVVAVDYSKAVDACYANLKHYPNLHVIQGDVYCLPLKKKAFPFVYSLGVLQHTPDVGKAFAELPKYVEDGGYICADFYWNRITTMLHSKYLLRPMTKRIPQEKLFNFLRKVIGPMLSASQFLGSIPILGKGLKRLIPIADYTGIYPLTQKQLREWALLDTFDMLAPDNPQSVKTIKKWYKAAGLERVDVFHVGHLVGIGYKPL